MKRKAYLSVLTAITAALGWYTFDGIFTTYPAALLCDAIHAEDIELVQSLLDRGIDPNWKNSYGKTSLRVAEQHPALDIFDLVRESAALP